MTFEIDGIELTWEQARRIFEKVEIEYYKDDVREAIDRYYKNDKEIELLADDDIENIAYRINDVLGMYDDYFDIFYDAVSETIEEYMGEKRYRTVSK